MLQTQKQILTEGRLKSVDIDLYVMMMIAFGQEQGRKLIGENQSQKMLNLQWSGNMEYNIRETTTGSITCWETDNGYKAIEGVTATKAEAVTKYHAIAKILDKMMERDDPATVTRGELVEIMEGGK